MELVRVVLCALSVFLSLVSDRLVVLASFSQATDSDFTFSLPAGRKECFYQTMKKEASLEIEYQVINMLQRSACLSVTHNRALTDSRSVEPIGFVAHTLIFHIARNQFCLSADRLFPKMNLSFSDPDVHRRLAMLGP